MPLYSTCYKYSHGAGATSYECGFSFNPSGNENSNELNCTFTTIGPLSNWNERGLYLGGNLEVVIDKSTNTVSSYSLTRISNNQPTMTVEPFDTVTENLLNNASNFMSNGGCKSSDSVPVYSSCRNYVYGTSSRTECKFSLTPYANGDNYKTCTFYRVGHVGDTPELILHKKPAGDLKITVNLSNNTVQSGSTLTNATTTNINPADSLTESMMQNASNFISNGECTNIPVWTTCGLKSGGMSQTDICYFSFSAPNPEGQAEALVPELLDEAVALYNDGITENCDRLFELSHDLRQFCPSVVTENYKVRCLNYINEMYPQIIEAGCGDVTEFDCSLIGDKTRTFLNNVLTWVQIGGILLVIVLGSVDFIKAIAANDADAMKKFGTTFIKRLVALVIIFLIPAIIKTILSLEFITGTTPDDPLCGIAEKN